MIQKKDVNNDSSQTKKKKNNMSQTESNEINIITSKFIENPTDATSHTKNLKNLKITLEGGQLDPRDKLVATILNNFATWYKACKNNPNELIPNVPVVERITFFENILSEYHTVTQVLLDLTGKDQLLNIFKAQIETFSITDSKNFKQNIQRAIKFNKQFPENAKLLLSLIEEWVNINRNCICDEGQWIYHKENDLFEAYITIKDFAGANRIISNMKKTQYAIHNNILKNRVNTLSEEIAKSKKENK